MTFKRYASFVSVVYESNLCSVTELHCTQDKTAKSLLSRPITRIAFVTILSLFLSHNMGSIEQSKQNNTILTFARHGNCQLNNNMNQLQNFR